MPRDEWLGWQAYWQLEPWGCLPADQRAEYQLELAYAIASKPHSKIPRFIERDPQPVVKPDQTPEELEDNIRDFFAGYKNVTVVPLVERSGSRKAAKGPSADK